jgi:hypothetical protein
VNIEHPAIAPRYEAAVVALLNAINAPQRTEIAEDQAEAFVEAMADLIITTLKTYVEENHDRTDHH